MRSPTPNALTQLEQAVPLLAKALADPKVRIVERAVDSHWLYDSKSSASLGWNPFRREIYIGRESLSAALLREPGPDLRDHNEGDLLLPELMFVVHDYLHIWASDQIRQLRPELDFGTASLSADKLEDQAFALLVTEAAATVGLDYWWLSHVSLAQRLDVGSRFATLTVSYQTRHVAEYRRFCPELEAQAPAFFEQIARFYGDGIFPGFSVEDIKRSPLTLGWLRHEISYGAVQRKNARSWLAHLAGPTLRPAPGLDLSRPFDCEIPWRQQLMRELGERLWELVKSDAVIPVRGDHAVEDSWAAPQGEVDFRFTNALALADEELERTLLAREFPRRQLRLLADQLLRARVYPRDDELARGAIEAARTSDNCASILWTARQLPAVDASEDSSTRVRDLFVLK